MNDHSSLLYGSDTAMSLMQKGFNVGVSAISDHVDAFFTLV